MKENPVALTEVLDVDDSFDSLNTTDGRCMSMDRRSFGSPRLTSKETLKTLGD